MLCVGAVCSSSSEDPMPDPIDAASMPLTLFTLSSDPDEQRRSSFFPFDACARGVYGPGDVRRRAFHPRFSQLRTHLWTMAVAHA